ncbi:hypothetical protein RN001_004164 [Aquatica leii]|uniref:Glucose-methanol-choline oxidoreductase N-terminal domain-containing protein n=1 Tax=Aquatica leii TaxID=1421715 RepID=A0AAN7SRU3_9COLE|nr:hypothetical protein RN001_004164 [Aquatica leii]
MRLIAYTHLIILLQQVSSHNYEEIKNYVSVIEEGIVKANSFILPEDASMHKPKDDIQKNYGRSYDYVIVGGGSAGAVIASRLSEDPEKSVLLLEAGGIENVFVNIPAMALFLQGHEFNWNYKTTPQRFACLGMINQECKYPRGKGLGGSSLINGLIYSRGNKDDYDNWQKMGNPGWSYKNVLPYFKKSENFTINGDLEYHETGGNLNVEYHKPSSPQLNAFLQANVELGYKIVDYNGKSQIGASKTQFNYIKGKRGSTAKVYLNPVLSRDNLDVLVNSYVTKVLIDKHSKKALGVIFSCNGTLYSVRANKEVILSAGVIGSPQILMLSGIGPKEHLKTLGIQLVNDLPVGNSFDDHAGYYGLHFSSNYTEPSKSTEMFVEQYLKGYGPYTIAANLQGIGFYKSKYNNNPNSQNPDFELLLQPSNNSNSYVQKVYHYTKSSYESTWGKMDPQQSFSIICIVLHPKSSGTIRLKSSDPFEYPLIDAQYLSDKDDQDIKVLYEATQLAIKLIETNAFKKINASVLELPISECTKNHQFLSKNYWYCHLRHFTSHVYHGSGTCKMGPNPIDSVVDHELKVHGVNNLRVVDASVFPTAVAGHNHAPVTMIAEKASDLIKNECKYDSNI